jgi:hypothetical protein
LKRFFNRRHFSKWRVRVEFIRLAGRFESAASAGKKQNFLTTAFIQGDY